MALSKAKNETLLINIKKMKILHTEKILLILISIIPISILIGPAISLVNIIIFDVLIIYILIIKKDFNWISSPIIKILLILYLYLIFNSLISQKPELNLFRNLGFLRQIIFFLGVNYILSKNENLTKVFKVWSLTLLIVVIDIFIEKTFGSNIFGFSAENSLGSQRIVSFFKDEAIPGSFVHAFSFMLIGFYLMKFNKLKVNYSLLLISLIILFLFSSVVTTGERSNSLKFLFCLILFLIFLNKIKPIHKFIIFSFIISTIVLLISFSDYLKGRALHSSFYLVKTYAHTFQNPTGLPGGNPYAELHRSGYEVFKKYPFFGIGNKNYRYESCTIGINKYYYCTTHPHQIYFEFLSEHGLIGTTIMIVVFFIIFFKFIKIIILSKKYVSLGCFVYLIAIFLPIIPSGAFFSDYNLTLLFINMSMMYGSNQELNIFNNTRKI